MGGKERQAAALWSTTWEITPWRARALACWRAAVSCSKGPGSRLSRKRSGQKAELCHSNGWPTPRLQGSQKTIDDGFTSSYMVLPHAARPCAAMQHSCHLSDAMAAPKRERLSGMGSQLRRHSAASWHITLSSLAAAPIACALPLRLGGLERRAPALGAAPRCIVCAPCSCDTAHRGLTGMGGALVGCLGGCGPASDVQRRPRSLDSAFVARSRKRRAASKGPPVCSVHGAQQAADAMRPCRLCVGR